MILKKMVKLIIASDRKTFCLEGLSTNQIQLVGTNLQASIEPNMGYSRSISFCLPPRTSEGIIALTVSYLENKRHFCAGFLAHVDTQKIVDLENWWLKPGKLVQIVGLNQDYLRVTIESKVYTSDPRDTKLRFVTGNLLCRFLMDEVTAKVVEVAAKCHQEEMSASEELAKIRNAMGSLQETAATDWERVQKLIEELETLRYKREKLEALVAQIQQNIANLVTPIVTSLNGATFGNRKEVVLQASVSLQNLRTILLQQLKEASYC